MCLADDAFRNRTEYMVHGVQYQRKLQLPWFENFNYFKTKSAECKNKARSLLIIRARSGSWLCLSSKMAQLTKQQVQ